MKTVLNFYRYQINDFQPELYSKVRDDDLNIYVLRDVVPAGLLVDNLSHNGTLVIDFDFVVPQ